MSRSFDAWRSKTPEEAARRRFGLWSVAVLIPLLPIWWIWGADLMTTALRPVVGLFLVPFGFTGTIEVMPNGTWSVGTHLTENQTAVAYPISADMLRRMLLSVPLTIAFMFAPPRLLRPWRALVISAVVLSLVFALSLVAVLWGQLAPILDPKLASATMQIANRFDQVPLHPIAAQIALVGRYVAMSIAPLLTAILLWATLNPAALRAVIGDIVDPEAVKPDDEAA